MDGSLVEGIQTSGDVGTDLNPQEFPGSVVVRTPRFHCQGPRFNLGQRTGISQVASQGQKTKQINKPPRVICGGIINVK